MHALTPEPPAEILPVCMARPDLDNLPEFAPPAGWSFRWYRPGDEVHWQRIHRAAEVQLEITPGLFRQQFGDEPSRLRERQCYLVQPQGEKVGTATAWFDEDFLGGCWGRVHWVALVPAFQGQGLGKVLLAAVCRRLRALGHGRAFLRTATGRIPAINLYLRFGFQPLPRNAAEERLWKTLAPRLRYPLASR
jgi:GNAT superfamily N-acetyltransferase